eukprot:s4743_g3.t1
MRACKSNTGSIELALLCMCDSCLNRTVVPAEMTPAWLFGKGSECVITCPSRKYAVDGTCQRCDLSCKSCEGSAQKCTSCAAEQVLDESSCVDSCPAGKFEWTGTGKWNGKCVPCHASCATCSERVPQQHFIFFQAVDF